LFDHKSFLATLTSHPGVYCMRDAKHKVLYVGKAKNLNKRLASYFRGVDDPRIEQLVSKIAHIDITVTNSEKEALLLENSLIKSLKPHFNILFRDDKSYPYLFISAHLYPRLVYLRGKQKEKGQYFGPYPSALAVKETLSLLQKLFKLRQCDDIFFKNRSRPCLQYQIRRCTAPCVNYITPEAYHQDVENVRLFLSGKAPHIIEQLVEKMKLASQHQDYEQAAVLRDQMSQLRSVFDQQIVHKEKGNVDVLAAGEVSGRTCIQLLYIRQGRILDTQTIYPLSRLCPSGYAGQASLSNMLRSYIIQFYLNQENKLDYPHEILINHLIEDQELISDSLSQLTHHKIKIIQPQRGDKVKWLDLAEKNAKGALERKVSHISVIQKRLQELKKVLGIVNGVQRIECFDISHLQGEATVASCVVFDQNGPLKSEYRYYNCDVKAGDDYAAMEQTITKRYLKRKVEELFITDILIVDGGKGQLHRAKKALLECQILDVMIIGIAKGEGRKPGLETLFVTRSQSEEEHVIKLPPTSPALHLLQHIRDEAHRFAISAQRRKVSKTRKTSPLESIPGVGAKRRQQLLNNFGGLQGLMSASHDAIAKVPGIGEKLGAKIYSALHGE